MSSLLRLREEQPGVVGVTATVWAIEDGTLCCRRLVNDRVVSEETRELQPEELERVRVALGQAAFDLLPVSAVPTAGSNLGRLVLEADGKRWETAYRKGTPAPELAARSPEARLRAVADTIRTLTEKRP
jgi:hypothetical protein